MGLDINEREKNALPRLVVKAGKNAGNQFAGGIMDHTMTTKELNQGEFLQMGFYFPVDSVIWDAGFQVSAAITRDNNDWDCVAQSTCVPIVQENLVRGPRNCEGVVRAGMQFFSPRDKLYGSVDPADDKGTTPFFPGQAAKRDNQGYDIDWSVGDATPEEIPLHSSPGWLNKSDRMTLVYDTMTTSGGSRKYHVNFTKGKGRKKRGFKVEAGTMLVYWVYNNTGVDDDNLGMRLQIDAVPRINFFPLKDIVQNLEYGNRSEQRWGANHQVVLQTDEGHGVGRLFTAARVTEAKP